jgi:uncharacterized repeat protein (TIGR01451 family)
MKRFTALCLALSACLGVTDAAAGSVVAAAYTGAMRPVAPPAGPVIPSDPTCDQGQPGLIIHDDDLIDDGFNYLEPTTEARFVDKFTPPSYPATFSRVCVSLFSGEGIETLDYEVVVYKDDGPGGAPGSLLGAAPVVEGRVLQLLDLPVSPRFQAIDIADLGINLESGSAYIGLRWNPSRSNASKVYLSADASQTTPVVGGYSSANGGDWTPLTQTYPHYRALMVRAAAAPGGPRAPWLRTRFDPTRIMNGETSTLTIKLSNVSQSTAAVLSEAFTDSLPAGLVVAPTPNAATTCAGTLSAVASSGAVSLAAGASIPAAGTCTISVDVTATVSGNYLNRLPAGALKTQHGSNVEEAEASLHVGNVFPEPYCNAAFPAEVRPITHVKFADIDKTSDAAIDGTPALEDFTSTIGHVAPGQVLPMTVAGNSEDPSVVTVYVDWNGNGVFTDPGETYAIGQITSSTGTDGVTVSADIAVPATASGTTRLRVAKVTGGPNEPCNWLGFGQSEDYTLQIGSADAIFANGFER